MRQLTITIFFMICVFITPSVYASSAELEEKARHIIKLSRYVSWERTERNQQPEFHLCILQEPRLANKLKNIKNIKIKRRALLVRSIYDVAEVQKCHVLFINRAHTGKVKRNIALLNRMGILTISDADKFIESGGMIKIFSKNDQYNFSINLIALRSANLLINHAILRVADHVRRES